VDGTDVCAGRYEDRRTNHDIDCSQTIWVLASNLGDEAIGDFYEANLKHLKDEEKQNADIESLLDELRNAFRGRWGVSIL
jgi:ATP-dependent Clp protease ATP-binding subunit ClpA